MKLLSAAAVALFATAPAFASTAFLVDFEQNWAYGDAVDNTYAASGVTFTNVLGLSNDADFSYYSGAPSVLGTAFAQLDGVLNTAAFMNVAGGVDSALSFYYSSPSDVVGAVKAYAGLNGSGALLGSFDLTATDAAYGVWAPVTFSFSGTALSFDLSGSANVVGLDNISAVPETGTALMLLAGAGMLLATRRRKG